MRGGGARLLALGVALGAGASATATSHAPLPPDAGCPVRPAAPGPGSVDPFRPPAPKATELNAAAKVPYRQGKWDEARELYRSAASLDPEFLAPKLNVACSFVRQERFAEATAEVIALLDRAYVPWAREILEAADLGALKVRPEMKQIRAAMSAAAARWGEGLDASVLFVARTRPPLHVPDGPGVFLLNPQQEVWAFTPGTQRYRQLTSEDGHVVALARSGRRILYVTAEKLVRGAAVGEARPEVKLRGVALHTLTLPTMSPGPVTPLEGDVRRIVVTPARKNDGFVVDLDGVGVHGRKQLMTDGTLVPTGDFADERDHRNGDRAPQLPNTTLTGTGAAAWPDEPPATAPRCLFGPETVLKATHGIGWSGLPIP